jgi:hypothetical protein
MTPKVESELDKMDRKRGDLLFARFISKSIARVKNAQIIYVLHVALLEVQSGTVLFR